MYTPPYQSTHGLSRSGRQVAEGVNSDVDAEELTNEEISVVSIAVES